MNATRVVPGRPAQTGNGAAQKIAGLVTACLEPAPALKESTVATELERARPYLAQLVNAGHLARHNLVLLAGKLRLNVTCPVGTKALDVEENLTPARGAATAQTWMLHIPAPTPYEAILREVCDQSPHLTTEPPPESAQQAVASRRSVIDLAAFERAATRKNWL